MIQLIKINDNRWNEIVYSFTNYDTYYTKEYVQSFCLNEDGTPFLIFFRTENVRLCYPIMEKDISNFAPFRGLIENNRYFDWNTPYGYGGPLSNRDLTNCEQELFFEELKAIAKERNVVSQFIRFHPMIKNQNVCKDVIENIYLKDTIYIDLNNNEDLMNQMDGKNRNLIRKAIKNGVSVFHDKGDNLSDFINIYNETMVRDCARDFYFFSQEYYQFLKEYMSEQIEFFYAVKDDVIVAASIFFILNGQMHYHLSGNLVEYRTFAPTNLLLYEAAKWGRENGCFSLQLGGGVGIEDSLFHFKKQFNKNGRVGFFLGRNIFDKEKYDMLLSVRKENDINFDINNTYYIQYRKP